MLSIFDKYSQVLKDNFDAQLVESSRLMVGALQNAGRFAVLNVDIGKSSLERLSIASRHLTAATEPQQFMALMATHAQPNVEMALSYGRRALSIASRSHGELTRATEARIAEINRKVATAVDDAAKSAPAGTQHVMALVKSAIGHATVRYQQMSNTAHQAVDVLEANLSMAASQIARAGEEKRSARN